MSWLEAEHYLVDIRRRRDRVPSFDTFPFSLPAVSELDTLRLQPDVTFIVGENCSGKSTLEAVATACGFNPQGGTKNFNSRTRRSHSGLHEAPALVKGVKRAKDGFFLRAESFFNVATEIESLGVGDSYGGRSLHEQSHGEAFFALMTNRFGRNGLYILDEPEAALSPSRQLAMLVRMHELIAQNSQFIIATHSPILMAYPDGDIYQIDDTGLVRATYVATEHLFGDDGVSKKSCAAVGYAFSVKHHRLTCIQ